MPDAPDTPIADSPPGAELLDRYFAGTASTAEREAIQRWVRADPRRPAILASLRASAGHGAGAAQEEPPQPVTPCQLDVDAGWHAARTRVGLDASRPTEAPPRTHRPWPRGAGADAKWSSGLLMIVAAAGLVVGAVGLWRVGRHTGVPQQFREFATTTGSRSTITLRDGTQLVLAPATRLRVPSDFGRRMRTVDLEGEALFTVVHDAAHPFAVRTARAVVRDVGTTFVVRAYADDAVDRVVVQEGRVDLGVCPDRRPSPSCGGFDHATSLVPGDLATIADTAVSVRHAANVAVWTAWVQGGLVFEDAPLREVLQDISRAFGVQITVADSALFARHITTKLSGQPLDLALDEVTQAIGARYERAARGIVIRSGRAGARGPIGAPHLPLTTAQAPNTGT